MTVFLTWPFAATGSSATRTLPDRLADVINVKDYGATGNGVTDDTNAVQAAINAAFGSSASPHGSSNATQNKPLFFPAGNYNVSGGLTFTSVSGGRISGASFGATQIIRSNTGGPVISAVEGFENCVIERMFITGPARSSNSGTIGFDLDWTGSGVGIDGNTFREIDFTSLNYGLRIGNNGNGGGRSTTCIVAGSENVYYGLKNLSTDMNMTFVGGGMSECVLGIWFTGGSMACVGWAGAGSNNPYQTDFQWDSSGIFTMMGGRSESGATFNATKGKILVYGCEMQPGSAVNHGHAVTCDSPAVAFLTGCSLGSVGFSTTGDIHGSGDYFLKGVTFVNSPPLFTSSGFTGKIWEFEPGDEVAYASLPSSANAGTGLTVSISSANSATWGDNVTAAGANTHVMVRWNGTNWTVVGI